MFSRTMHAKTFDPSMVECIRQSRLPQPSALLLGHRQTLRRIKVVSLPAVLIALFLFSQLFNYHALKLFTVTPDKVLFALIFLFFTYAALRGRLRSISLSGAEVCMILFTILCTASYIVTNPDATLERYKWLTTIFNLTVYPFSLYLFAKKTCYTPAKTLRLLWGIVFIGAYLAFTASFEHFGINALIFPKYITDPHVGIQFGRARGPIVSCNPMGEWLILTYLAICLVMPFAGQVSKALLQGLLLLVGIGIYFTSSRGVWVSFAAVLALTAMRGGRFRTQSRLILILVFVLFLAGVGSKLSFWHGTLFSRRQGTIDYRISNNATTFKMGMANFMTGVGYGSFFSSYTKYFGSNEEKLTKNLSDGNHNTFLGLFADLGFPGAALYVFLFGYLLKECARIRNLLDPRAEFERNLALSSMGLLLVAIIEAMSTDLRFDPTLNTVAFLFLGITASITLDTSRYRKRVGALVANKDASQSNTNASQACRVIELDHKISTSQIS